MQFLFPSKNHGKPLEIKSWYQMIVPYLQSLEIC